MSPSPLLKTSLAAVATLLTIGISGCTPPAPTNGAGSAPSSAPTLPTVPYAPTTKSSEAAEPADYRDLLLSAGDLSDAEDTFTQQSQKSQPNGSPGASAFFVNTDDNRAITDTFLVYSDAATATATLKQAAATLPTLVAGGTPAPLPVGADGVIISGTVPDEDKAVTLVFFTEGRALVRLEFQSATGDSTTVPWVTNVAKMQQIALRVGLDDAQ